MGLRIGGPEHRRIEHRHAQHLDHRLVEIDQVVRLVLDHALGLDRPGRGLGGAVLGADIAGRVDRLVQLGDVGAAPHQGVGGDLDVVLQTRREPERHARAEILVERQLPGELGRPIRIDDHHIALGGHHLGVLVVA